MKRIDRDAGSTAMEPIYTRNSYVFTYTRQRVSFSTTTMTRQTPGLPHTRVTYENIHSSRSVSSASFMIFNDFGYCNRGCSTRYASQLSVLSKGKN